MGNVIANFKNWYQRPFSSDMDVMHWFLFLGLLIVLMAGWRIILVHVTES